MTAATGRVAMVLAAGRGVRMRPLSDVLPKPALPLPSGPVVASALRLAAIAGARRAVVNTWHLAGRMAAAVHHSDTTGMEVLLSAESELMGTSGGLAIARGRGLLGGDGPVLVINGDGIFGLDPEPLLERHLDSGNEITLALLPHADPRRWSRVLIDRSGLVTALRPAGAPAADETPLLYPGVMVVSRQAVDRLREEPGDTPDSLWWPALERRSLGGVVVPGWWREVGTPADYLSAAVDDLGGGSSIHPSAKVSGMASVRQSLIGRDTVIEVGASVKNSVVAEGASVGERAVIRDSVVMGAVAVRPGEEISDRFVASEK